MCFFALLLLFGDGMACMHDRRARAICTIKFNIKLYEVENMTRIVPSRRRSPSEKTTRQGGGFRGADLAWRDGRGMQCGGI